MLLPEQCSLRIDGKDCSIPPSFIVSIKSESEEFMVGVVCTGHKEVMEAHIQKNQLSGKAPKGKVSFEPIKMVSTNCIKGNEEDYLEVKSRRDEESE